MNFLLGVKKVKAQMQRADLIPDIIPDERKPLEPPTQIYDEEYDEGDDPFDNEKEKNISKKQ